MTTRNQQKLLFLYRLEELLKSRKEKLPENSYTSRLFREGIEKIAQKVGEESVEVIIASMNSDSDATVSEVADLLYHLLVLLVEKEIPLDRVAEELRKRSR